MCGANLVVLYPSIACFWNTALIIHSVCGTVLVVLSSIALFRASVAVQKTLQKREQMRPPVL